MPSGNDPPSPRLPKTVFDALNAMTYDAAAQAFADAAGKLHYLFVEGDPAQAPNESFWFYGTDTEGGVNPRAQIPSGTAEVITQGTYETQTNTISYNSKSYRLRLQRDPATNTQVAEAIGV